MELHQIRYFVVLAATLHFTRAAEACNVSQPALTKAIQRLEDELGGTLFFRERGRTRLTELGQLMRPPLERALEAANDAKQQAEMFRRRGTSPLRIGVEYSVAATELTPALAALRRHCDDIDLTLQQASQPVLCERMLAGEIDIALLIDDPALNERLHRWPLFDERYTLICPPEHRFANQTLVSVADLAQECVLLLDDADCPIRRFIAKAFAANRMTPRREQFGGTHDQIVQMVLASFGVSLIGERTAALLPLQRRPFVAEPDGRTVALTTVAGRRMGPTPALFLKLLRARSWSAAGAP